MVKKRKGKAKSASAKSKAKKPVKTRQIKKRVLARRAGRKAKAPVIKKTPESMLEKVGEVTHYFPHVKAAAVKILKNSLKVGDAIYIKGHTTDFKEKVSSIQLDRVPIQEARKAQEIGLMVKSRVRIGDSVYRI